ncbi:MAG: formylmethanofuran--tetrahydromethanopterin N-formyltransferase [Planctomycetaceae bacterium]|nr:formylmethanofuran--tetrahydromethanopterin N-formyltransferase [Planctomycetaceae bacterium]
MNTIQSNATEINGVKIHDTFAEAFGVTGTRLIITAISKRWVQIAAQELTGYGTSVIACDAEAGVEQFMDEDQTPDGRPGVAVMLYAFNRESLGKAVVKRVGQCILTCPTTAVYNGVHDCIKEKMMPVGKQLRYFGDGFQSSKVIGAERFWRIPVMDGEFFCVDSIGSFRGIAGGNLLIGAKTQLQSLEATEAAVREMDRCPGIITPFPGGIVRSGSKVGSQYKGLVASTNDAHCPTLSARSKSHLLPETTAMYEIVIDGNSEQAIATAMKKGLYAASQSPGVTEISGGNYGGKLGKHHFHLLELLD